MYNTLQYRINSIITENKHKFYNNYGLHNIDFVVLNQVSAINRQVFPTNNKLNNGLLGADILEEKSWTLDYSNNDSLIRIKKLLSFNYY